MRAARWLVLAALQAAIGLGMAAATASGNLALPASAHAVALGLALALGAGGLALGLAPPLLRRETDVPILGELAVACALASDAAALLSRAWSLALAGIALLLLVAHLPAALLRGRAYAGEPEPEAHRVGDRLAAGAMALGAVGALAAGLLFLVPPRDVPTSALALLASLALLPTLVGGLALVLPRLAGQPLSGATILGAGLGLGALGAAGLAFAYADPLARDFRWPATALAAGIVLALVALLRVRLPGLAPRFAGVRPALGAAAALAILCAALVFVAMLGGRPGPLTGVALDLTLALAAALLLALALAAGPLLFEGEPRPTRWARWAAGLLITGLFLVAPAAQYDRSAFPGVAVEIVALLVAAWGMAPMLSAKPRMRRR
ncbi:MAG: hypothetical protein QOE90_2126 [Thermoplasmata archaeon]|jgi:hypothetical protein|nr:hypothetical protein [Thermoplasmata archaeon]